MFGRHHAQGEDGRLILIQTMVFGASLFLRLMESVFRPAKLRFTSEDCGSFLHESDAMHCGAVLNVPPDGYSYRLVRCDHATHRTVTISG
jgi:voltage-gated potassium channel